MTKNGLNTIIFGPPGVGKGAQAGILSHAFDVKHLSTGQAIRDEIQAGSELGRRVQEAVSQGAFADDETVLEIVMWWVDRPECRHGFVMDGFPRNVSQAEQFDKLLQERGRAVDHALFISAPEETVLSRLGGRLICSGCGSTYHRQFHHPRVHGVCDTCKGKLVSRHDDRPEVHRERLREYREKTAPLAEHYRSQGVLREINGDQLIGDVAEEIFAAINPQRSRT